MKDDAGISNVLGASLMFGLAIISLVMVQTSFVPVWAAEDENVHLTEVLNQFATLKSTTDRGLANETGTAVAHVFTGSPDGGRNLLSRPTLPGQISFLSDTDAVNISSPAITVLERDGRATAILSEDWVRSNATDVINDVGELDHLRIRLTGNESKIEFKKNGFVRLELTDRNDEFAGSFMAYTPEKEKEDVWIRVRDATGYTVIDQEYAADVKFGEHGQFWINALDPAWPFEDVLYAAEGPYSIALSYGFPELDETKWPDVDYAVAYTSPTSNGGTLLQGSSFAGQTIYDYEARVGGGQLVFEGNHQYSDSDSVIFENGAVIVEQHDGAAIIVNPDFRVEKAGSVIILDMTIPRLEGDSDSAAHAGAMTVTTRPTGGSNVVGTATEWKLEMSTEFPQTWASYFARTLDAAGMATGGEYTISTSEGSVTLHLIGDPANGSTHDIQVSASFPTFLVDVVG